MKETFHEDYDRLVSASLCLSQVNSYDNLKNVRSKSYKTGICVNLVNASTLVVVSFAMAFSPKTSDLLQITTPDCHLCYGTLFSGRLTHSNITEMVSCVMAFSSKKYQPYSKIRTWNRGSLPFLSTKVANCKFKTDSKINTKRTIYRNLFLFAL